MCSLYRTDIDNRIFVGERIAAYENLVSWYNSPELYKGMHPQGLKGNKERRVRQLRKHIDVPMQMIVKEHSRHMGDIDLAHILIEIYQINIKSKIWYNKIAHCFDVAVVNAWLLCKPPMHGSYGPRTV